MVADLSIQDACDSRVILSQPAHSWMQGGSLTGALRVNLGAGAGLEGPRSGAERQNCRKVEARAHTPEYGMYGSCFFEKVGLCRPRRETNTSRALLLLALRRSPIHAAHGFSEAHHFVTYAKG